MRKKESNIFLNMGGSCFLFAIIIVAFTNTQNDSFFFISILAGIVLTIIGLILRTVKDKNIKRVTLDGQAPVQYEKEKKEKGPLFWMFLPYIIVLGITFIYVILNPDTENFYKLQFTNPGDWSTTIQEHNQRLLKKESCSLELQYGKDRNESFNELKNDALNMFKENCNSNSYQDINLNNHNWGKLNCTNGYNLFTVYENTIYFAIFESDSANQLEYCREDFDKIIDTIKLR